MFIKAFVIVVFCIAASYQYTPFKQCQPSTPAPLELRVKECKSSPCKVKRGSDIVAEWDFKAVSDTDNLTPKVTAILFDIEYDFVAPEQDACKSLINGNCPLKQGDFATYAISLPTQKFYPPASLNVQFSLFDNYGNNHTCFRIDIKLY